MTDSYSDDRQPIEIGRAGVARLVLGPPTVNEDGSGYARVPICLETQGLSAEGTIQLEQWGGGVPGLVSFFQGLAAEWRGWSGQRVWDDDGGGFEIVATHDGIGTVQLRIATDPFHGFDGVGSWNVWLVVPVDPGALDAIADGIRHLLTDGS